MLTACGIETLASLVMTAWQFNVATVLTACGIETVNSKFIDEPNLIMLQQCLPLAVLKQRVASLIEQLFSRCNSAYRLRY